MVFTATTAQRIGSPKNGVIAGPISSVEASNGECSFGVQGGAIVNQKSLQVASAVVAAVTVTLAAIIPRLEIGHGEPDTLGGPALIYYDYLIVTRVAVLLVGLAVAGTLFWLSRHRGT